MIQPLLAATLLLTVAPATAFAQTDGGDANDDVVTQAQLEAWTEGILKEIAAMRETSFPRAVSVAASDAAKLREYMKERMEKTSTPAQAEAEETCGKLLGLIPGDMDYHAEMLRVLDSQVGGFYDPETEGFYLMDRFGGFLARTILAHELTHALDDQLYDIDGTLERLEGSSDRQFAYHAVVEGSGTALMNAWTIRHMSEMDPAEMANSGDLGMEELKTALPYTWKPLLGVYMRGAAFLNRTKSVMRGAMKMPALADIDAAFKNPPRSSEQVLHPEKYWDAKKRDEPIDVTLDVANLPEGWEVLHEDTFGEFFFGLVVEPLEDRGGVEGQLAVLATKYTYPASEGWGGDRYVFLGKGDARTIVSYSVWDTDDDATEFRTRIEALQEHLSAAAAATANARGVEGSGASVHAGVGRGVWLLSWTGASADEISAVRNSIRPAPLPD